MAIEQTYGPIHEGANGAFIPDVLFVVQGDKVWFAAGKRDLTESAEAAGATVVESMDDLAIEERDGHKYVKDGKWYVEGTYQLSDVKNANGRTYSKKIWQRIIADPKSKFMENVRAGGVVGHIEHPGDGRTDGNKVSMKHLDFKLLEDGKVKGKSMLTSNTPGRELQALTADGVRWGVSSRGSGSVGADGRVSESDFQLETFDAVMKPSTPGAYPTVVKGSGSRVSEDESASDAASMDEAATGPIFSVGEKDALIARAKSEIKAPYVNATVSTLGGDEQATLYLVASLAPKDKWENGILENSRYFRMSVTRDGTMEVFSGHGTGKFRKSQAKSMDDVVARINAYIAKAGQVGEDESTTNHDDASACIREVETLIETDVAGLDESESSALVVQMVKSLGRVNRLDKSAKLPRDKAHDMRDWLTRKLGEIYHGTPQRTTQQLGESDDGTILDPKSQALVFERVVSALQQSVSDANSDADEQRELSEANQARAEAAEERLAREQDLRQAAVERATDTGLELSSVRRQLTIAMQQIEELTAANVEDPVQAAVAEAVDANPQLSAFRSVLERSDDVEQVYALAATLSQSSGGENGTGRARTSTPRPTLPQGNVVSESTAFRASKVVTTHRGANAAGRALARMTPPVPVRT